MVPKILRTFLFIYMHLQHPIPHPTSIQPVKQVINVGQAENNLTTVSPAIAAANGRTLQNVLVTSMKQPESVSRLVEVMPLLRSLTRTQRVGLAEMLQQAPRVAATLAQQGALSPKNATLGRLLPHLDVVSLLKRGDEEAQREEAIATRARALEIVEAAVSVPDIEFADRNGTEEEIADLPTAQELNSRRQLLPSELLALIAAHRRSGSTWPRPPSKTVPNKRPPAPERVSVGLQPPPLPPGSADECHLISNNICLEAPDYPRDAISDSLLHSKDTLMSSEAEFEVLERRDVDDNLVNSDPPGSSLCSSFVKFAKPKRARNLAGHWKFIVNTGEEHVQTVRIEMCKEPGTSCNFLANGVTSQCMQVFSNHRLMSWDKEHGLHLDVFKVPTCCSCHIQAGYGPAVFPSVTYKPRDPPPPIVSEPEFDDGVVAAQETAPTSRPPPADWERPNRRRRPTTVAPPLSKPTFHVPPKTPFASPAPVHETSTYPPIFNKDMRKRIRPRDKIRQDLDDSASVSTQRRRRPVAISSDKIRNSSGNSDTPAGDDHSRINYSYHPIIDFFRNEQTQSKQQMTANRRSGTSNPEDDWRPISPAHHIPNHRGI